MCVHLLYGDWKIIHSNLQHTLKEINFTHTCTCIYQPHTYKAMCSHIQPGTELPQYLGMFFQSVCVHAPASVDPSSGRKIYYQMNHK